MFHYRKYNLNLDFVFQLSFEVGMTPDVRTPSPVSVIFVEDEQTESRAASTWDKEINIQWYIPTAAELFSDTENKV